MSVPGRYRFFWGVVRVFCFLYKSYRRCPLKKKMLVIFYLGYVVFNLKKIISRYRTVPVRYHLINSSYDFNFFVGMKHSVLDEVEAKCTLQTNTWVKFNFSNIILVKKLCPTTILNKRRYLGTGNILQSAVNGSLVLLTCVQIYPARAGADLSPTTGGRAGSAGRGRGQQSAPTRGQGAL